MPMEMALAITRTLTLILILRALLLLTAKICWEVVILTLRFRNFILLFLRNIIMAGMAVCLKFIPLAMG